MSEEILALMREDAARMAGTLTPDVHGSASQDAYAFWDEQEKVHLMFREPALKKHLQSLGLENKKPRDEDRLSEVNEVLARANRELRVDYIGKIACLPSGVQEVGKQKFYNLEGLEFSNVSGPYPATKYGLESFFGKSDPYGVVAGWFGQGYRSIDQRDFSVPNFTLILLGDSAEEGRLLGEIFTILWGGKSLDPADYMARYTSHLTQPQLAEALYWRAEGKDLRGFDKYNQIIRARSTIYGKLSTYHGQVNLPFCAQRTIFVENTSPELKKLPVLCFEDRVHVLKLRRVDKCSFDLEAMKKELPQFVNACMTAPACSRGYISAETKERLFQASLPGELYRTLCASKRLSGGVIKSEAELGEIFTNSVPLRDRRNWEKEPMCALLEIVAKHRPSELRMVENDWVLNLPQPKKHDNEPSIPDDN